MGILHDSMIKALPGIIGAAVGFVGSRLVDSVMPPRPSSDLFEDYYRAVEQSNLPRTNAEVAHYLGDPAPAPHHHQPPQSPPSPPPPRDQEYNAGGKAAMDVMTSEIDSAISALRNAKSNTRCSVCKSTLGELEQDVIEKTEFIRQSNRMWHVMQNLKESGDLPEESSWSTMTEKQKDLVRQHAGINE